MLSLTEGDTENEEEREKRQNREAPARG